VQVEHPVTELVTEIDIVMEQILIASGNELSFKQEDIYQDGHAIECRIYAEDPANNFLPSPGDMSFYMEPGGEDIRIDTGIAEATTIHSFYDPMISKLIVWSEDRESARSKMIDALTRYTIHGIKTNISFLMQVLKNIAYVSNKISTKYCDEHTDDLIKNAEIEKSKLDENVPVLAYLIYSLHEDLLYSDSEAFNIWKEIGYWRERMEIKAQCGKNEVSVEIAKSENGDFNFFIGNREYDASLLAMEYGILDADINGEQEVFFISKNEKGQGFVSYKGFVFEVKRNDILVQEDVFGTLDHGGKDSGEIVSPMPGKVIKINVKKGKTVKKGDVLMVVEAMKMENNILAPKDGKVEEIKVKTAEMVDGSTELIILGN
jgi:acetyl/propionyl-CoA carboxylase alpha subunit